MRWLAWTVIAAGFVLLAAFLPIVVTPVLAVIVIAKIRQRVRTDTP